MNHLEGEKCANVNCGNVIIVTSNLHSHTSISFLLCVQQPPPLALTEIKSLAHQGKQQQQQQEQCNHDILITAAGCSFVQKKLGILSFRVRITTTGDYVS